MNTEKLKKLNSAIHATSQSLQALQIACDLHPEEFPEIPALMVGLAESIELHCSTVGLMIEDAESVDRLVGQAMHFRHKEGSWQAVKEAEQIKQVIWTCKRCGHLQRGDGKCFVCGLEVGA